MKNTPEVTSSTQATSPQTGYRIPGYLLAVYALLLFTLGWFGHQHWVDIHSPSTPMEAIAASPAPSAALATQPHDKPTETTAPTPAQTAVNHQDTSSEPTDTAGEAKAQKSPAHWQTAQPGELPSIAFSAHVYTSDPDKRSVTLNGERYREGDTPYPGLIIEQIEQDMVIFSFDGEPFILDSLQDWPGGKPGSDTGEDAVPKTTSKPEKTIRTTKK